MDKDAIPKSLLNCCICGGPETPTQKLVQATPKVYPTLSGYAEAIWKCRNSISHEGSMQGWRNEIPQRV